MFVGEAVRSVLEQSWDDFELIVVDDGSGDGTLEVVRGIRDARVRVIAQEHLGAHAAINRGLEEATGDFVAILNSDDAYGERRLETMVRALEGDAAIGLAGSYIQIIDADGRSLGVKHGYRDLEPWALEAPERSFRADENLRLALLTENYLATTSNFVCRRAWQRRVGGFRPLRYTHDWDYALRMAAVAPLLLLPETLLKYRVHSRNTIREDMVAMVFEICWCLAVHLPVHVDGEWFWQGVGARRVDQLLHSIYTYGCERVLAVMLAQGLHEDLDKALRLLDPGDEARAAYLEFIRRQLGGKQSD